MLYTLIVTHMFDVQLLSRLVSSQVNDIHQTPFIFQWHLFLHKHLIETVLYQRQQTVHMVFMDCLGMSRPLPRFKRHQSARKSKQRLLQIMAIFVCNAGKKWFMQPSLSAQQGAITGPAITFCTKKYVEGHHLATCTIRMETASILILRKVLNPDLPPHQAIIDQSEAAAPQQKATSPVSATPAAAYAASRSNTSVKKERRSSHSTGIKRERTADAGSSSKAVKREPGSSSGVAQQTPVCIDLSGIIILAGSSARRQQKAEGIDLT